MLPENWGGGNSMYIHSFNYKILKKIVWCEKKCPPPPADSNPEIALI